VLRRQKQREEGIVGGLRAHAAIEALAFERAGVLGHAGQIVNEQAGINLHCILLPARRLWHRRGKAKLSQPFRPAQGRAGQRSAFPFAAFGFRKGKAGGQGAQRLFHLRQFGQFAPGCVHLLELPPRGQHAALVAAHRLVVGIQRLTQILANSSEMRKEISHALVQSLGLLLNLPRVLSEVVLLP